MLHFCNFKVNVSKVSFEIAENVMHVFEQLFDQKLQIDASITMKTQTGKKKLKKKNKKKNYAASHQCLGDVQQKPWPSSPSSSSSFFFSAAGRRVT